VSEVNYLRENPQLEVSWSQIIWSWRRTTMYSSHTTDRWKNYAAIEVAGKKKNSAIFSSL